MKLRRLVLIDHDAALREEIERALAAEGYQVEAYADASEAWDVLRGGGPLDLVVTEIVSPAGRPHGLALAHTAQRYHPAVSVIFITADRAAAEFAHGEPCSTLLLKPFDMPALLSAVHGAIGGRQPLPVDQQPSARKPLVP